MLKQFTSHDMDRSFRSDEGGSAPMLADAERARRRSLRATRWFAGYLAVIGVASVAVLPVIESVLVDGLARAIATGVWAVVVMLAGMWAERQPVHPASASRIQHAALGIWLAAYLFVVGPFVRGMYGEELVPWLVASAAISLPYFVAAALVLARR